MLLFPFIKLGVYSCLLLLLGQLVLKKQTLKSRLLSVLFLCLFLLIFDGYLFISKEFRNFPHLIFAHVPISYLVGPILYLYFTYYITNTNKFQKKHLLHLFPFIISIIMFIPFYLKSEEYKIDFLRNAILNRKTSYHIILSIFASFSNLFYCLLILKKSYFLIKKEIFQKEITGRYLILIVFFILLAVSFKLSAVFTQSRLLFSISLVIITVNILGIYLLSWRYPNFLQELNRIIEQEKKKYEKSHIGSLDTEKLKSKLENYMISAKPYLEEDVSLEYIAKNLQITNHQLSQFLNQVIQKSFYQYINEFRIREATFILKKQPEINILNVAYQVGFNSKSSFNTTFKKITGKTPSQYRKTSEKRFSL